MNQLFWKEWQELRLLPLASAMCAAILIFAAKATFPEWTSQPFRITDTLLPLVATWMIFGLLAGANTIAQDAGSGGLIFLGILPVSRGRVWGVKVVAALGAVLLSAMSSALVWALLGIWFFHGQFVHDSLWRMPSLAVSLGLTLLVLLNGFAIAVAASAWVDRPLTAMLIALFVVVVTHSLHLMALEAGTAAGFAFLVLSIPAFAAFSFYTFTRTSHSLARKEAVGR